MRRADAKLLGDIFQESSFVPKLSHVSDILGCKLRPWMFFTLRSCLWMLLKMLQTKLPHLFRLPLSPVPIFLHHIKRVVLSCPKEEMIRTNTSADITVMKDPLVLWDRTVGEFIRDTMGRKRTMVDIEEPIPVSSSSNPEPTDVCFVDLLPETCDEGRGESKCGFLCPVAVFPLPSRCTEFLATTGTQGIVCGRHCTDLLATV